MIESYRMLIGLDDNNDKGERIRFRGESGYSNSIRVSKFKLSCFFKFYV